MITVHKYPLRCVDDTETVEMPSQARVLHVQVIEDTVFLWALVDTELPVATRKFRIAGTGHPIDEPELLKPLRASVPQSQNVHPVYYVEFRHVGTVVTYGGKLVWHVFDMGEGRS